jgi:hypothetical protein
VEPDIGGSETGSSGPPTEAAEDAGDAQGADGDPPPAESLEKMLIDDLGAEVVAEHPPPDENERD